MTVRDDDPVETAPAVALARRHARSRVRGRWAVLTGVVGVVAGVAVVAAALPQPGMAPTPVGGVGVSPADAVSSSAFCTAGTGTAAASTIYLTNTTPRAVTGVMTTVGASGSANSAATTRRAVEVPPLGTAAVNPSLGMPTGSTASSFTFAGGGVSADQVVSGAAGWSTAPCASEISAQWAFAGGSTTAGDTLTLSLFDPAAPPAVVNVSFLTAQGLVAPQPYQGLAVLPGRLVVENVGDYVQNAAAIATVVTAESGAVVSDELQQTSGAASGISLRLGSPVVSTTWRFAATTALPGSTVGFELANPGATPVTADLSVGLPSATVPPGSVVLAPQSIAVFDASTAAGWPVRVPYAVTVQATGPIVVGRSVSAPGGAAQPAWGSSAGTLTLSQRWLVPAPGVPHAPGVAGATVRSLAVADPGPTPARVAVSVLGGPTLVAVTVAPGSLAVLGAHQLAGLKVLTVTSSQPVDVEEDSGPSGAPGVVSSSGFPFGG